MLLYIALCLAASLAAEVKVPKPVFSPVYSMRIELHYNGILSSRNIWIDKVNNRTRTDFLDVDGQAVYEHYNEEYKKAAVHWVS
ncbi:hypothetical protein MSG28_013937 [Choristoneura fumiferana]|uniref:Uncharacterized protein n=1 Tax=Choristoneura fumiferana TaxID=7141 RepID=A0ACC0K9L4_CHOFU|nr:hypothetical protein MSG28_013937 [Choristoneura fumiferana]